MLSGSARARDLRGYGRSSSRAAGGCLGRRGIGLGGATGFARRRGHALVVLGEVIDAAVAGLVGAQFVVQRGGEVGFVVALEAGVWLV